MTAITPYDEELNLYLFLRWWEPPLENYWANEVIKFTGIQW